MFFVDEVDITVRSGGGGDGCVAFLREKYRPHGGPAGGDGGDGGDIVFRADPHMDTLLPLARQRRYVAKNGRAGEGKNRAGRSAEDLVIDVPRGTIVRDADEVLADLATPGETCTVCPGGRGGRGNVHFADSHNQAPRHAEPGSPGVERKLHLELKLIADIGLVGLPNAGKSTLLSRLSAARPKVAAYPFTTRRPCLGIVESGDFRQFVLADIPGLIAGAHAGAGLGHEFLRHVERTRILLHLVDLAPPDGSDPREAYRTIRGELEQFNPALVERPEVVGGTKMDLAGAAEALQRLSAALPERTVLGISAVTGEGLKKLLTELFGLLEKMNKENP
jgi:GTP-binding protein